MSMERIVEMPDKFREVRERMIAEFSKNHSEGLNLERAEDFIRSQGIEVRPYAVFEPEDFDRIKTILSSIAPHWTSGFESGEYQGIYLPEIGYSLVRRDRSMERMNGALYTEGLLVHELAHATTGYQQFFMNERYAVRTPRVGFCLTKSVLSWGSFLEEGWADMNRASYVMQHASDADFSVARGIFAEQGVTEYINLSDTIPATPSTAGWRRPLPLPLKYLYASDVGVVSPSSAFAGYAVELLCSQIPELHPALVAARSASEGLRDVARLLEGFCAGLYRELQKGEYSGEVFFNKLARVSEMIDGGVERAIHAEGQLRLAWEKRLSEE